MLQFGSNETERSRPATVCNVPVAPDQVKPVRKSVILEVGRVLHVIDQRRNRKLQLERTDLCDFISGFERRWLCEQDPLALIGFHLPFVSRVRLSNVDDEEFNSISESAMKFLEVPSLGTKGRSGVAAEDKGNRLLAAQGRELHLRAAVEPGQFEVGRFCTDCWSQCFALRDELQHDGAALGLHSRRERHHPGEVFLGQILSQ